MAMVFVSVILTTSEQSSSLRRELSATMKVCNKQLLVEHSQPPTLKHEYYIFTYETYQISHVSSLTVCWSFQPLEI